MTFYRYYEVGVGEDYGSPHPHPSDGLKGACRSAPPTLIVANDGHLVLPVLNITEDYRGLWWTRCHMTIDSDWRPPDGPGAETAGAAYRYYDVFRQGQVLTSSPISEGLSRVHEWKSGCFVVAVDRRVVLPVLNIEDGSSRRVWWTGTHKGTTTRAPIFEGWETRMDRWNPGQFMY